MEWTCRSEAELPGIARAILDYVNEQEINTLLFIGDLGAGKTTLVKALCDGLGCIDDVSSPTFALVNEYRTVSGGLLYHIDLYRIDSLAEANQIGIGEYLYSGEWVFIEWPEVVIEAIFPPFAALLIDVAEDGSRRIRILKNALQPANG